MTARLPEYRRLRPAVVRSQVRKELDSIAWWAGRIEAQRIDGAHAAVALSDAELGSTHLTHDVVAPGGLMSGVEDYAADPRYDEECGLYDDADGPPDPRRRRALYPAGHDLLDHEPALLAIALLQHMEGVAANLRRYGPPVDMAPGPRGGRWNGGRARKNPTCDAVHPETGALCRKRPDLPHDLHSAGRGASYVTWTAKPTAPAVQTPQSEPERPQKRRRRGSRPPLTANRYPGTCVRCHLLVPAGAGTLYWPEREGAPWRVTHRDQATCLINWEASAAPVPPPVDPEPWPGEVLRVVNGRDPEPWPGETLRVVPDRNPDRYTDSVEAWM